MEVLFLVVSFWIEEKEKVIRIMTAILILKFSGSYSSRVILDSIKQKK